MAPSSKYALQVQHITGIVDLREKYMLSYRNSLSYRMYIPYLLDEVFETLTLHKPKEYT